MGALGDEALLRGEERVAEPRVVAREHLPIDSPVQLLRRTNPYCAMGGEATPARETRPKPTGRPCAASKLNQRISRLESVNDSLAWLQSEGRDPEKRLRPGAG